MCYRIICIFTFLMCFSLTGSLSRSLASATEASLTPLCFLVGLDHIYLMKSFDTGQNHLRNSVTRLDRIGGVERIVDKTDENFAAVVVIDHARAHIDIVFDGQAGTGGNPQIVVLGRFAISTDPGNRDSGAD